MPTIRQLREDAGLTTTELAAKAGVSVQTLYRIERGEPVSRMYVARVCKALNVAPDMVQGLKIKD
jgi:transcriptional regulator with XRE-family HTH domain